MPKSKRKFNWEVAIGIFAITCSLGIMTGKLFNVFTLVALLCFSGIWGMAFSTETKDGSKD